MVGGTGNDVYVVDATTDVVAENSGEGSDVVQAAVTGYTLAVNVENLILLGTVAAGTGNAGDNTITGNAAANTLNGGAAGNDTLIGGDGNDILTGGSGTDQFVFNVAPSAGNVDTVSDFTHGVDELVLAAAAFGAIGAAGAWSAGDGRFNSGAGFVTGQDATDRIIYNTTTGDLYYDADGSGGGAAVKLAVLTGKPPIDATDFTVT
ncbi:MAG TPA: calcium-binding protein [Rhodocyclaceae bacterium]|nr:calcium-binding protein [Rhodocyclaceae bacterium]